MYQMRIVQDLGLISATGTAAAPSSPNQCGAQVEAALQAARQELSLRAASRGANGVFQTSYALLVPRSPNLCSLLISGFCACPQIQHCVPSVGRDRTGLRHGLRRHNGHELSAVSRKNVDIIF
jgi:hypothetical protein